MTFTGFLRIAFVLATVATSMAAPVSLPGPEGRPLPIVLPESGGETEAQAAKRLSETLERIFSLPFPVVTASEDPAIRLRVADGPRPGTFAREDYTIRTSDRGIEITGATGLALRHAVWDLLHRLGYRQFFPGPLWEVVPELDTCELDLDLSESPDYASRRVWYGFGLVDHNRAAYLDWVEKNRMDGGFILNTGQSGSAIGVRERFLISPQHY